MMGSGKTTRDTVGAISITREVFWNMKVVMKMMNDYSNEALVELS
jgi:hypothetical protein